jgi:hypothetical protein
MTKIALVGAGGKMGCRLTDNFLKQPDYAVSYLEVAPQGIENLRQRGVSVSEQEPAITDADVVILALPDVAIGKLSEQIIPQMKPGALVLTLDPAAPLDGVIAHRDDLNYVIAHPCHPSVFNWEPTEAAFRDFYGGISAKQSIVVALMHGSEEAYALGERVSQDMYGPVKDTHRITLEQMAILEPAMVETLFKEVNGTFSDAAYKISKRAKPILFREGWQRIFEMDDIREQVKDITAR